jgi:signal transduction histidine kinase
MQCAPSVTCDAAQKFTDEFCEHVHQAAPIAIPVFDRKLLNLEFDRFLVELSVRFASISPAETEAEILGGLRRLCELLGVDCAAFAELGRSNELEVTESYFVPGVRPKFAPIGTSLAWYIGKMMQGKTVRFTSVDDLGPQAAKIAAYARASGIKSHVGVPVQVKGVPRYLLGVATYRREVEFSDDVVARLHLVGEIFANSLTRRDAEISVRRMQMELAHVTRVSTVGQLAPSIAHELNQPIMAVVTNAQAAIRLLSADRPDLAEIKNALADIVSSGRRAGDIVQRSHLMLKRRELASEPSQINEIIHDAASLAHSEALIRRVNIALQLAENLPTVRGDQVQLQQVMLNLIMNAIDATSEVTDGPRQIVISSELTPTHIRVIVRDTGEGLSPETQRRLFEPFYTTKSHGLGMGLTISRNIIQSHGGVLNATANTPRGACLICELPWKKSEP